MTIHHFCTFFDEGYLPKAEALWRSLERHAPDAVLWTLCLDDSAAASVEASRPRNVRVVRLAELEAHDAELAACRSNRSQVEYYFTAAPAWIRYLLTGAEPVDRVTYLDADMWFFSSPEPAFAEIGDAPVAIVEHRFGPALPGHRIFGRFNVGWMTFRRDPTGLACVEWWRERCLEWCYDRAEEGRFASQGYLEQFPELFPGVHVVAHLGVNAAPWNIANAPITRRNGLVHIGDDPLIAFHFQGLKRRNRWFVDPNVAPYQARPTAPMRELVYRPYIEELERLGFRSSEHGVRYANGRNNGWKTKGRHAVRDATDVARRRIILSRSRD